MRKALVDAYWHFHGLRAVILENEFLRVVVLPEAGARIVHLIYKPHDVNLLWNNPRVKPARLPFGVGYDNAWCGGWDELFPNNILTVVESRAALRADPAKPEARLHRSVRRDARPLALPQPRLCMISASLAARSGSILAPAVLLNLRSCSRAI